MAISRRAGLAALAAPALLALAPAARLRADLGPRPAFVAARRGPAGYSAAVLDARGRTIFTARLASRGHGAAVSPEGRRAVVFARRPGRFALALDLDAPGRVVPFTTPPRRHFFGHGFFSPDGRLLLATENDFEAERGVLGIYDSSAAYRRIGEMDTHGVGPHEAVLMHDGRTIAVANGGIATHPDYPRRKLNLDSMESSIAYLAIATGELLERAAVPPSLRRLSIRHIAETGPGTIWFGGQYEGPKADPVAVAGWHRRGEDLAFLPAPQTVRSALRGYVGSVAASRDGSRIALTSPRGGRMLVWDARSLRLVDDRRISDVCGVAPAGRDFIASDGTGRMWFRGEVAARDDAVQWDNHLAAVPDARPMESAG